MFICDFHIHSKYSRATSPSMDLENLSLWAKRKGVNLLGTGDFTHPIWFEELKKKLRLTDKGVYEHNGTKFILTSEVCNIFTKKGKVRKIHNVIFLPSFEKVFKLNQKLERFGELGSNGRPILHLEAEELVKMVKDTDSTGFVIPAHIWTPHFSLFGANSGFDHISECYGKQTENIFALETGLSSDPPMNWRLSELDGYTLVSNSDAHSPGRIGREANVFKKALNYLEIKKVLEKKDKKQFLFTVEYFPEEGKYHFDGHRNCKSCLSPQEAKKNENRCPVCGRKVTIGVMHRVLDLADREKGFIPKGAIPCKHLIPLEQIIASVLKKGVKSKTVQNQYLQIINQMGSEFKVLLEIPGEELKGNLPADIARAIIRVRKERVNLSPGYDGEYGKIEIPLGDGEQQKLF